MEARCRRLLLLVERTSWALGLVGLVGWGAFHVWVAAATRHDLEQFAAIGVVGPPAGTPDQSLWSPNRISAWRKAVSGPAPAPLAVLRIPKIRLEVAVLPGTDDRTLDRAVGHIEDTAQPGTDGNSGIAGHRDGFFRGLKDVTPGDAIEVDTLQGKDVYRVERTWVVDPEDVSVLEPTSTRALTLVTCYPFYFVGSAPKRFIVRAVRVGDKQLSSPSTAEHVRCLVRKPTVSRGVPVSSHEGSGRSIQKWRECHDTCNESDRPGRRGRVFDGGGSAAQQTATSSETKAFEVIAVDGNQLVVRLPEGTRELTVADDFRFIVNGQSLSVRELKVGMKGTATITTRTTVTPVTVTEVKNGTVVVRSGSTIIVRTEEGVRSFTQGEVDKRGVKIMRSGKPAQVSDFREGDQLSATIITSRPPQVMTEKEVQATLASASTSAGGAPKPAAAPGAKPAAASCQSALHRASGSIRRESRGDIRRLPRPERSRRPPARGRSSASRASCRLRWGSP